jgi:hypothetical protein
MYRLLLAVFCASLSVTIQAQPQDGSSAGRGAPLVVASGFVLLGHCTKKCEDMRCPDQNSCNKWCNENKGTLTMCPKAEAAKK